MNKTLLMAVSAVALTVAMPAMAQDNNAAQNQTYQDQNTGSNHNRNLATVPPVKEGAVERTMERAGDAVSRTAKSVERGVEDTYENVRAAVMDERGGREIAYTDINTRSTAHGIIGKDVRNESGESIAKVEDIIFDQKGDAQMIVLANGGFMGLGEKKAAFNYGDITRKDADGDIVMPVTKDMIKKAAEFSDDRDEKRANVRKIPANGFSAKELLGADILDSNGKEVAEVKDIVLGGGGADRVIVAFDEVLGMGGERAVFKFDDLKMTRIDNKPHFQLSAAQSSRFETYRDGVKRSQ